MMVMDGVLDACAKDPKTDRGSGRDDQDGIETIFEMPSAAPTTRDPQWDPVIEEGAADLA